MPPTGLDEGITVGLQEILVRSQAIDDEHLAVESTQVSYKGRIRPPLHPLDVEFRWRLCLEQLEGLTEEEMIVLWAWQVAEWREVPVVEKHTVELQQQVLPKEQVDCGSS